MLNSEAILVGRSGDWDLDLFSSPHWFRHLLEQGLDSPATHHVLSLGDGSGELHLMRTPEQAGLTSLSNYYSGLFAPTGPTHGMSTQQWLAVVQTLRGLPGSDQIMLQPLAEDAQWCFALERALRETGYRTDRFSCFGNWYQTVPEGGFESYWAQRPSALRNSVERGRRRLDKAGDWRIDIHSGEDPELEIAIAAYGDVYRRSWKAQEPRPDFVPGLIRLAAEQGWLRLGVLWLEGEPIACQLWLVAGGKANIFKLAFVQGREKLSAGSVLTAALMQQVMDVDGVVEVDYLSGDDVYKANWMANRRERVGLVAFDIRRIGGLTSAARHFAGRFGRSLLKLGWDPGWGNRPQMTHWQK